jgi:3-hydroxybutyrate dehydrogenase
MLKGKVAVITGATSGIGLGLAHAFAGAGCAIEINGFAPSVTEIGELVDGLEQRYGVRVVHYPADLAHPSQCVGLIEDAQQRFVRMDILINNAGIQHVAPVESFPPEQWDAILAVNLSAAFHLTRCALPGMQRREYGRILNVASVHGLVGSVHKAAYVAAKHGLIGLTKVVALENATRESRAIRSARGSFQLRWCTSRLRIVPGRLRFPSRRLCGKCCGRSSHRNGS